ncbi:sulfurtransferase TusA family protein [Pyrodictium delaneyi]|uniref:sulfurtransferase TusA family protein n=1 Tax=Pyrodictium delaneyi TaxID=1273541 RepID=UPI0015D8C480|nr:sulfurtransferase TusA family protein [Pyrodictium delaneyi]
MAQQGEVVDLRGKICPEPYVRAMKLLEQAPKGSVLRIVMDSWRCVIMLVSAVKALGMKVDVAKHDEKSFLITIEKSVEEKKEKS